MDKLRTAKEVCESRERRSLEYIISDILDFGYHKRPSGHFLPYELNKLAELGYTIETKEEVSSYNFQTVQVGSVQPGFSIFGIKLTKDKEVFKSVEYPITEQMTTVRACCNQDKE